MTDPVRTDFTTFADPDDFCRECKGSGWVRYPSGHCTTIVERCDQCGGHGFKTIRVRTET